MASGDPQQPTGLLADIAGFLKSPQAIRIGDLLLGGALGGLGVDTRPAFAAEQQALNRQRLLKFASGFPGLSSVAQSLPQGATVGDLMKVAGALSPTYQAVGQGQALFQVPGFGQPGGPELLPGGTVPPAPPKFPLGTPGGALAYGMARDQLRKSLGYEPSQEQITQLAPQYLSTAFAALQSQATTQKFDLAAAIEGLRERGALSLHELKQKEKAATVAAQTDVATKKATAATAVASHAAMLKQLAPFDLAVAKTGAAAAGAGTGLFSSAVGKLTGSPAAAKAAYEFALKTQATERLILPMRYGYHVSPSATGAPRPITSSDPLRLPDGFVWWPGHKPDDISAMLQASGPHKPSEVLSWLQTYKGMSARTAAAFIRKRGVQAP